MALLRLTYNQAVEVGIYYALVQRAIRNGHRSVTPKFGRKETYNSRLQKMIDLGFPSDTIAWFKKYYRAGKNT